MKIGIIGTGVFSTSLAITFASNKDNNIVMWSEDKKLIEDYQKTKKLHKFFKDKSIPKNIQITNNYEEVLNDAQIVFLITSVKYLENVCKEIKKIIHPDIPICIGTKGIATDSKKFVYEIVKKHLKNKIAVMSGPTFAIDVANLDPIGFTIATKDKLTREMVKKAFDFEDIRIEESIDILGVSVCGCVKNIYALGAGIIKGLGNNESTKALYLTYVYQELSEILYKFKSNLATLNSLAGFGDLILTCNSEKSRNYKYGEMIGKKITKKKLDKYLEENTVEGINTLNCMYQTLKRKHTKCPILNTIYEIITNNENPKKLIEVIIKKTTN